MDGQLLRTGSREAAKHHLFVDFHGSFKPAGLEYKYPNVLSYEGVRGMEQMGGCYPDNSLYLPFMRNAVGPMDYTRAMISMQPNVYRSERPNAASIGTRAYQLALFVVLKVVCRCWRIILLFIIVMKIVPVSLHKFRNVGRDCGTGS